jgi:hypothetical protein
MVVMYLVFVAPVFVIQFNIQDRQESIEKPKILYGMSLGATAASTDEDDAMASGFGTRVVKTGQRVRNLLFLF